MDVLFFDTETNGLPKNYNARMNDLENWPRVIQLGWQRANFETGEVVNSGCELIKPNGWEIPSAVGFMKKGFSEVKAIQMAQFWTKYGYTTEKSEAEGKPMEEVLGSFITDHEKSGLLVAHNMSFDHSILGAEMIRYKMRASNILPKLCTMHKTTDVCRIPGNFKGSYKWPKMEELYKFLFGTDMTGAHDAGDDVTACRLAFFELIKRKLIKI